MCICVSVCVWGGGVGAVKDLPIFRIQKLNISVSHDMEAHIYIVRLCSSPLPSYCTTDLAVATLTVEGIFFI